MTVPWYRNRRRRRRSSSSCSSNKIELTCYYITVNTSLWAGVRAFWVPGILKSP